MHLSRLIASNVLSKHFKQTADKDGYKKKYFTINTQHKLTDKIRDFILVVCSSADWFCSEVLKVVGKNWKLSWKVKKKFLPRNNPKYQKFGWYFGLFLGRKKQFCFCEWCMSESSMCSSS